MLLKTLHEEFDILGKGNGVPEADTNSGLLYLDTQSPACSSLARTAQSHCVLTSFRVAMSTQQPQPLQHVTSGAEEKTCIPFCAQCSAANKMCRMHRGRLTTKKYKFFRSGEPGPWSVILRDWRAAQEVKAYESKQQHHQSGVVVASITPSRPLPMPGGKRKRRHPDKSGNDNDSDNVNGTPATTPIKQLALAHACGWPGVPDLFARAARDAAARPCTLFGTPLSAQLGELKVVKQLRLDWEMTPERAVALQSAAAMPSVPKRNVGDELDLSPSQVKVRVLSKAVAAWIDEAVTCRAKLPVAIVARSRAPELRAPAPDPTSGYRVRLTNALTRMVSRGQVDTKGHGLLVMGLSTLCSWL